QYHYTNTRGEKVVIQEHSLGHSTATARHGGAPHFNVRQVDKSTGEVLDTSTFPGTHGHYNF
ncbi:HNH/endonuclease VII fold putative polymorphic toxin, partial [Salinivibrio sp. MA440]